MSEFNFESLATTKVKWFGANDAAVVDLNPNKNRITMFDKWPDLRPAAALKLEASVARMVLNRPTTHYAPEGFSVRLHNGLAVVKFALRSKFHDWAGPELVEQAHTGEVEGLSRWVLVGSGALQLGARAYEATDWTPRPYQDAESCGLHIAMVIAPLTPEFATLMPE